jgi:GT2 family glycosyltransferase
MSQQLQSGDAKRPVVALVLVNWNGQKWLEHFLPALFQTAYQSFNVYVVDNASTDGSLEYLAKHFPQVRVLPQSQNWGFAQGNNVALPHLTEPFLALVNTDVAVTPEWLGPLVDWMNAHPDCAAVQPKIRAHHRRDHFEYAGAAGGWIDRWGYPFCRGRVMDSVEVDQGQYDSAELVFWATGACMLIRRSVVDVIGLFDPRYFAHWEEIDFCWRAQNAGYSIAVQPQSVVYHVGGGTLAPNSPRKVYLNFRNSLMTYLKNLPLPAGLLFIFRRLVLDGVAGLRFLLKGEFGLCWAVFRSHVGFYAQIRYCLAQRKRLPFQPKSLHRLQGVSQAPILIRYFARHQTTFSAIVAPIQ